MQYITPLAPAYAEIFLLCMLCAILLLDCFLDDEQRGITYVLTLLTLGGCAIITWVTTTTDPVFTFSGMFVSDLMSSMLKLGIYGSTAMAMV